MLMLSTLLKAILNLDFYGYPLHSSRRLSAGGVNQAETMLTLLTPVRFAHSRRKEKLREKKRIFLG